jgi:conjugal transfer pilus assembly protein TraB
MKIIDKARVNSLFQGMPPKYKKYLAWGVGGLIVLMVLYGVVSKSPPPKHPESAAKLERNIFGEKDLNQQFAVARVSSQLELIERENKELKSQVKQLSAKSAAPAYTPEQLKEIVDQEMNQRNAKLKEKVIDHKKPEEPQPRGYQGQANRAAPGQTVRHGKVQERPFAKNKNAPGTTGFTGGVKDIQTITASSGGQNDMEFKEREKKRLQQKQEETFLPAGSIFSGTLITGLDVSCGKSSKKDPFPVLLRIKKEAILPNRYTADVRECFLIAAGWGDLGSERAYLRAERLSCIREDGKALETKIDMYAVGEDGKAGVRGRLVSKTGALLSKALLAGFMDGFAKVFTQVPVATLNTGPLGAGGSTQMPFQNYLSGNAMQSAGLQGAGSALQRLSNYYIDMAKNIFPVIEIDAGRALDFVLISGKKLALQTRKPVESSE